MDSGLITAQGDAAPAPGWPCLAPADKVPTGGQGSHPWDPASCPSAVGANAPPLAPCPAAHSPPSPGAQGTTIPSASGRPPARGTG